MIATSSNHGIGQVAIGQMLVGVLFKATFKRQELISNWSAS
jgi:hypothetical protein